MQLSSPVRYALSVWPWGAAVGVAVELEAAAEEVVVEVAVAVEEVVVVAGEAPCQRRLP